MKILIKGIFISILVFSGIELMAQDNTKPISSLSSKLDSAKTKKNKPEKPVDALSSKSTSSISDKKKKNPTQKLTVPKAKAVLTEKKDSK